MLSPEERAFIRARAFDCLNERNMRLQKLEEFSYSPSSETDEQGNLIAIGTMRSPEVQREWKAWEIKNAFQKVTLRDVFMQAIADEFNTCYGVNARFVPHAMDDLRAVFVCTYPTEVQSPAPVTIW